MNPREILKSVTENLHISVSQLTKECGFSKDRLHNIMQGKTKHISMEVATGICMRFPQFSRYYLLTGNGSMYADGTVVAPAELPEVLTSSQVILTILDWSNDSAAEFSRKTGISKGNVSSIISGKHKVKNITPENAERICKAYPELELLFVLNGEGNMLKDGRSASEVITVVKPVVNISQPKELNHKQPDRLEVLENQVKQLMNAVTDLSHALQGGNVAAEDIHFKK